MDIIISSNTHRTGSTLIQRIFNAREETLIWGEHGGALSSFIDIYNKLTHFSRFSETERQNYFGNNEDPNQWIASMTPEMDYVEQSIVNSVRVFLDSLYKQYRDTHDTIGFKEVRYGKQELELFKRCYPEAKIVLLVRHPLDT